MWADSAQDMDPIGVSSDWAGCDYPDAADFASTMVLQGGWFASGNNWLVSYFATLPPTTPNDFVNVNGSTYTQDKVYAWIAGNLTLGAGSVDPTVRQRAYMAATKLLIDMGLYAYLYQGRDYRYFRSWIKGYELNENPTASGLMYYWVTKG
jgi:hypothetical protein